MSSTVYSDKVVFEILFCLAGTLTQWL